MLGGGTALGRWVVRLYQNATGGMEVSGLNINRREVTVIRSDASREEQPRRRRGRWFRKSYSLAFYLVKEWGGGRRTCGVLKSTMSQTKNSLFSTLLF